MDASLRTYMRVPSANQTSLRHVAQNECIF